MNVTLKNQLGMGGFGTVYRCIDESGKEHAVKVIQGIDNRIDGVPCLIEASVMASYRHPRINVAKMITATPTTLYILQELAISDLAIWRRDNVPTPEQIRLFSQSLVDGCVFLHHEGIIHGDIKARNILIYPDGSIKITDFSLSMIGKAIDKPRVCSTTHRPLEVWRSTDVDEKSDIWALGCTIFEIVYGYSLFRFQGSGDDARDQSINALIDWYDSGFGGNVDPKINRKAIAYLSPELPNTWNSDNVVNTLILRMLKVSPLERPSAAELLRDRYFDDSDYVCINPSDRSLRFADRETTDHREVNQVSIPIISRDAEQIFTQTTEISEVCRLARKIYTEFMIVEKSGNHNQKICTDVITDAVVAATSLSISHKILIDEDIRSLTINSTSGISHLIKRDYIIKAELKIVSSLKFRLHRLAKISDKNSTEPERGDDSRDIQVLSIPVVVVNNKSPDATLSNRSRSTDANRHPYRQHHRPDDIFSFLNLSE